MKRLFVDTSVWFSYINHADMDHKRAQALLNNFNGKLMTSNFIFDETVTLCLYHLGHHIASRSGDTLLNPDIVDLIRITPTDERAAWELFLNRSDKTYSFTDCSSFVLMRRLNIRQAASFDADFEQEGFELA